MSEAIATPDPVIVSTDWLQSHLEAAGSRRLCVVDIRGLVHPPGTKPRYVAKRKDYDVGHIPGAVFVDWTLDIVDASDPTPVQVARAQPFADAMSAIGIGDETLVVAYDDHDHMFAGRLAWALRYYGHDAVRILDGGWSRWSAEGRPQTQDRPLRSPNVFTPVARPNLRRTADEVERTLGRADVLLLDARPPAQYSGDASAAARSGHIPGARNVHYAGFVDPQTGKFRSRDELVRVFANAGVDVAQLPREVILYCNGGVSCTVPLEALRMLGRGEVAVYDGSWNEWGNDDARPISSGPRP